MKSKLTLVAVAVTMAAAGLASADPWADNVVSYHEGSNPVSGYTDPNAALGQPSRLDDPASQWAADVTPINAPYGTSELVSIGEGGQLTVSFDSEVSDDPNNPFGIDLLIFGNAFYGWDSAGHVADGGVFGEGGTIEISNGGTSWTMVSGEPDGPYPTTGYTDWREDWGRFGTQESDFTLPVDPTFRVAAGMTVTQIQEGYAGSGGGVGVDIGEYGFSRITHVRIGNPIGSGVTPEIDAFADVRAAPEPSTIVMIAAIALCGAFWRCRRKARDK